MEEDLILTEEEERAVEEGYAAQALLDNPVFLVAIERIRGECAEGILTSPPDHQAAREDLYNLSRGLTAVTQKLVEMTALGIAKLENATRPSDQTVQDQIGSAPCRVKGCTRGMISGDA